uniref:Uncharacterized protein n=1 Tax=Vespula pensylvanica TaxID=30213 RepID=A0A834P7W8_VESPE|nr:hypothetical protein H0235_004663 [Vespula pensylvanica]
MEENDPKVGPRRANNCEQLPYISSWLRIASVVALSTAYYHYSTGKTIVFVIPRVGLYLRFAIALVLQSLETPSVALNQAGIPPSISQPEAFLPYISISALDRPPPQLDARTTFPPGKLIERIKIKEVITTSEYYPENQKENFFNCELHIVFHVSAFSNDIEL